MIKILFMNIDSLRNKDWDIFFLIKIDDAMDDSI